MSAIRVVCRSCGAEVNSAECDRDLRCTSCAAKGLISRDLAEYSRLWAKKARYARMGVALHSDDPDRPTPWDEQRLRLQTRMSETLHRRIPNPELATEALNALLSEARQRADTPSGRIVVPRLGQEILGGGARA